MIVIRPLPAAATAPPEPAEETPAAKAASSSTNADAMARRTDVVTKRTAAESALEGPRNPPKQLSTRNTGLDARPSAVRSSSRSVPAGDGRETDGIRIYGSSRTRTGHPPIRRRFAVRATDGRRHRGRLPATGSGLPAAGALARLSGARVGSVETLLVSDYDEPRRRVRLRKAITKTRVALWVDLPDVLAEAIEATLPPRLVPVGGEGRDPDAALVRLALGAGWAGPNTPRTLPTTRPVGPLGQRLNGSP